MQILKDAKYGSVAAFMAAANGECRDDRNRGVRDEYLHTGDKVDWYGADCRTGDNVQSLIRNGWPDGRRRAMEALAGIDSSALVPVSRKRRLRSLDHGDDIVIDRVWSGDLDRAWTTATRQHLRSPQQLTILANMLASGYEDSDVLFWRGAAGIAVADKLETAGYTVRLLVGFGGTHERGGRVSCRITVKDYDAPLDISTASTVILPGFFRAIGHGWIAGHCDAQCGSPGISVGKCDIALGEIFLSHEVRDQATAMSWAIQTINTLNCAAVAA